MLRLSDAAPGRTSLVSTMIFKGNRRDLRLILIDCMAGGGEDLVQTAKILEIVT